MIQRCSGSCKFPILHQFIFMQFTPGKNQLQLPPWQRTANNAGILNVDQGLTAAILCMKMRRIVVAVKHCDTDATEQTDFRHGIHQLFNASISYFFKNVYGKIEGSIPVLL